MGTRLCGAIGMNEKKKKHKKKNMRKILRVLCLVIGVLGLLYLVLYFWQERKNRENFEALKEIGQQLEEPETSEQEEEPEQEVNPINFEYWKSVNPEVYAWISIEDTNIDYPILQSATDDSYYLEHTIDGGKGYPGSIYTEKINTMDFTDFNTVIFGHNMKDGSMFKHLHKFQEKEFFDSHDTVNIYTETEVKIYRVYAAVIYDDRHILNTYDNGKEEDRIAFIQSLETIAGAGSFFREGMEIDENSKLVTLSTCIAGQSDKRYIVVASEVTED